MPALCSSQDCCSQCPWPSSRPLSTSTSTRDSWTLTGKFGSVFCGVTVPFSWVLVPTTLCCALQVCFPGGSQSYCWIPRLGNLLWALELLQQCKNFFGRIVLQSVGCTLGSSIVTLIATSSKRTYATCHASQVSCSQSPVPTAGHFWPMPPQETLKHSKASLDQCWPFKNLSLSVDFKLLDGMLIYELLN